MACLELHRSSRTVPRLATRLIILLACVGAIASNPGLVPSERAAAQGGAVYHQVLFEITQSDKELGGSTADQLSVIFSNRSVDGPAAPVPLFGDDILQEFSFSGRDFVNNRLRFSRRMRDTSFVEARFIRVINHGGDGWAGDTISITVDGKPILRGLSMFPRRTRTAGQNERGGIEKFNPREWESRSYWELDRQQSQRK
jgi:hypothetical protein